MNWTFAFVVVILGAFILYFSSVYLLNRALSWLLNNANGGPDSDLTAGSNMSIYMIFTHMKSCREALLKETRVGRLLLWLLTCGRGAQAIGFKVTKKEGAEGGIPWGELRYSAPFIVYYAICVVAFAFSLSELCVHYTQFPKVYTLDDALQGTFSTLVVYMWAAQTCCCMWPAVETLMFEADERRISNADILSPTLRKTATIGAKSVVTEVVPSPFRLGMHDILSEMRAHSSAVLKIDSPQELEGSHAYSRSAVLSTEATSGRQKTSSHRGDAPGRAVTEGSDADPDTRPRLSTALEAGLDATIAGGAQAKCGLFCLFTLLFLLLFLVGGGIIYWCPPLQRDPAPLSLTLEMMHVRASHRHLHDWAYRMCFLAIPVSLTDPDEDFRQGLLSVGRGSNSSRYIPYLVEDLRCKDVDLF